MPNKYFYWCQTNIFADAKQISLLKPNKYLCWCQTNIFADPKQIFPRVTFLPFDNETTPHKSTFINTVIYSTERCSWTLKRVPRAHPTTYTVTVLPSYLMLLHRCCTTRHPAGTQFLDNHSIQHYCNSSLSGLLLLQLRKDHLMPKFSFEIALPHGKTSRHEKAEITFPYWHWRLIKQTKGCGVRYVGGGGCRVR